MNNQLTKKDYTEVKNCLQKENQSFALQSIRQVICPC